jgi:hypothetical protein
MRLDWCTGKRIRRRGCGRARKREAIAKGRRESALAEMALRAVVLRRGKGYEVKIMLGVRARSGRAVVQGDDSIITMTVDRPTYLTSHMSGGCTSRTGIHQQSPRHWEVVASANNHPPKTPLLGSGITNRRSRLSAPDIGWKSRLIGTEHDVHQLIPLSTCDPVADEDFDDACSTSLHSSLKTIHIASIEALERSPPTALCFDNACCLP